MASQPQTAVFEQRGPPSGADLSEKKQASGTVAAPLDEEEPLPREISDDEQQSCRTTSIFAVAGCVSPYRPFQMKQYEG